MARIIDDRSQNQDQTIRIFDRFYAVDMVVSTNQYDIVHGYFANVCDTKQIADNFTAMFFRIATQTGVDALALLDEIRGKSKSKLDMNKTMCYYLNSLKSKTALYGISAVPKPVLSAARNVVQ